MVKTKREEAKMLFNGHLDGILRKQTNKQSIIKGEVGKGKGGVEFLL